MRHIVAVTYVALIIVIMAWNTPLQRAERARVRIHAGMTISQALRAASGFDWVAYSEDCMVAPARRRIQCSGVTHTFRNPRELIQWLEQRVGLRGQTWELRLMFRGPGEDVDLFIAFAEDGTVANVSQVTERQVSSI